MPRWFLCPGEYGSITDDPRFVLVALDDIGPQHISMSNMGCRLLRLDGANVLHGLGVARGILPACHGLFSWSKKLVSEKKLASPKILRGNT